MRTVDLFQSVGGGAPWVDRDKIPIPQADEQQRLFARLVQQLVGRNQPLPQLWYFPGTAKTMLILTSDAHGNPTMMITQDEISGHECPSGQDHSCIFAITDSNSWDWPTRCDLQTWQTQGHTFGIHPWRNRRLHVAGRALSDAENWFTSAYTVPKSATVRTHRVEWEGWTNAADVAAAHDIAMDVSFYHWGQWLQKPDGTWPHGYITGSGLPMKFIRADGTIVPVYQQLTQMADDHLFADQDGYEGLTRSQAVALSQSLIDASLAGDYSALTDIHHVDIYNTSSNSANLGAGHVDYARSKGVPIWNADQWLSFTQTRHDANFSNITWNAGVLSFNLTTAATGNTLSTILPLTYGGQTLQSVTVDGSPATFSTQTIKGTNVAFVGMAAGNHSVSATYDGPTPTPSNTPRPSATFTPTATPTKTPTSAPTNTPTNTPTATRTPIATRPHDQYTDRDRNA